MFKRLLVTTVLGAGIAVTGIMSAGPSFADPAPNAPECDNQVHTDGYQVNRDGGTWICQNRPGTGWGYYEQ
jgi:hypothetical protein